MGESKKLGVLVPLDETPPESRKHVRSLFEDVYARNRKLIGNLFFQEDRVTKTAGQVQEHITYKASGLTFAFLPETFIQSNVPTNEALVEHAMEMLLRGCEKNGANETVLDVYAGIGNLSLPIARKVRHVVAVEGHEASVLLGRVNMYQNSIENVTFLHRSAEKYLHEHVKHARAGQWNEEYPHGTRIIIDPPRTGCTPQVLHALLASGIPSILYISCNPVTLAGDLEQLTRAYRIADIKGLDMFPDISHVETLVLLERKA
jgi:23S rRNA (uracil1939-C5)-methyltransferase